MLNRNPKVEELEQLHAIKESKAYQGYITLLKDAHAGLLKNLTILLHDPKQIADHNYKVGILAGLEKAINHVDAIIRNTEIDLDREKLVELAPGKPRKVTHQ